MSSSVIKRDQKVDRTPPFPHPRADAAATEHGAANRSPPMAETVVWATLSCDGCAQPKVGRVDARARRPPPNDGVEEK